MAADLVRAIVVDAAGKAVAEYHVRPGDNHLDLKNVIRSRAGDPKPASRDIHLFPRIPPALPAHVATLPLPGKGLDDEVDYLAPVEDGSWFAVTIDPVSHKRSADGAGLESSPPKKHGLLLFWQSFASRLLAPALTQAIDGVVYSYLDLPGAEALLRAQVLVERGRLFIRSCYEPLVHDAVNALPRTRFLVTGTPGVGKSVFLFYVARAFLLLGREVVIHLLDDRHPVLFIPVLDGSSNVVNIEAQFVEVFSYANEEAVYVSDALQPISAFAGVSVVGLAPTDAQRTNYWKEAPIYLHMPGWQADELLACRTVLGVAIDDDTFRANFELWGGNPRIVFRSAQDAKDAFHNAFLGFHCVRTSEIVKLFGGYLGLEYNAVHRLVRYDSVQPFTKATLTAASEKFREWLYERLQSDEPEVYSETMKLLRRASMASEYRKLFEYGNHKTFVAGAGGTLTWWRLPEHTPAQRHPIDERGPFQFLLPRKLERCIFFKLPAFPLKDNTYYTPVGPNLAAVDAFILVKPAAADAPRELVLLQDTVSGTHPIDTAGLNRCIALVPTGTPVRFVFRIPQERERDWVHEQAFTGDSPAPLNMPQYIWVMGTGLRSS